MQKLLDGVHVSIEQQDGQWWLRVFYQYWSLIDAPISEREAVGILGRAEQLKRECARESMDT